MKFWGLAGFTAIGVSFCAVVSFPTSATNAPDEASCAVRRAAGAVGRFDALSSHAASAIMPSTAAVVVTDERILWISGRKFSPRSNSSENGGQAILTRLIGGTGAQIIHRVPDFAMRSRLRTLSDAYRANQYVAFTRNTLLGLPKMAVVSRRGRKSPSNGRKSLRDCCQTK